MEEIKQAALNVLLHNAHGPFQGLPRTAGWGYPEPYTRDWMIAALGILVSGNEELFDVLRHLLVTLAGIQTDLGHIPSLANNPSDCGASDTTPLFLIALALFQKVTGESTFLEDEAQKALVWLRYQSPDDTVMIAQQPTSDWRDEQWVYGYGMYVNTLLYACLRLYGEEKRARTLHDAFNRSGLRSSEAGHILHEGLSLSKHPYYALWTYKVHLSERFDLLGNSLAILFGLASPPRAREIIAWVEKACQDLRSEGTLALKVPPCLIPYIKPGEEEWRTRYEQFNPPGEYHNGGIWPFIVGFYIAALVAAGEQRLAESKFTALTELVWISRAGRLPYGFNEWFSAQDGRPRGQDWQTWSAAMVLYAAACIEGKHTPFFSGMRESK
jgi:Alkaline and neutral invertase